MEVNNLPSASRRYKIAWITLVFCMLAGVVLLYLLVGSVNRQAASAWTEFTPTPTPFQPLAYTPTAFQPARRNESAETARAAQPVSKTAQPAASLQNFYGVDFSENAPRVNISIVPLTGAVNRGKAIVISFIPAAGCQFGDQQACIFAYQSEGGGNVVLASVHSGVGGEGQAFRHALEGTAINQAAFTIQQIQSNMNALQGAPVVITQGALTVEGLVLGRVGRVPALNLDEYFRAPLVQALAYAASVAPSLAAAVNPGAPLLIIETCGWKSAQERWAAGVTSTSASVYLGVIQKKP